MPKNPFSSSFTAEESTDDRPAPAPTQRVRVTFVAECEVAGNATTCTIFGLPGEAEPYLREEFLSIVRALFGPNARVKASAVNPMRACDAAPPRRDLVGQRPARRRG
jgi:hypothetical protein